MSFKPYQVLSILLYIQYNDCLSSPDVWPPTPCDPLVPEFCSYPFPNDYWLIKDDNLSPVHLNFSVINFPIDVNGVTVNPASWNILDGFSPLPSILTYFANVSLDNSNAARLWNISQSLDEDSPIIILHASTGERIANWVELDHNSDDVLSPNKYNRSLMVWPAERLIDGERYIVCIRNLKDINNKLILAGTAFTALRDNISTNNSAIEDRREYYNEYIFPYLIDNNIVIDNTLQISWDFTIMSSKQLTNRMIIMRDDAFSRINYNDGGVKYRILEITHNITKHIARSIYGVLSVPWYLNQRGPGQYVRIVTEWDNPLIPVYQRNEEVYFELLIPNSVANRSKPAVNMQFGHGLFQTILELFAADDVWDLWGFVTGGVNWIGLAAEDAPFVKDMISTNLTNFDMIPDRLHQGMLNALFYAKLFKSDGFINNPDIFSFNGYNIITGNEQVYYFGGSLGGIMGSVYMSLSTDVVNGVCNVPGFPFELLLPRSSDFLQFQTILEQRYNNNSMTIDFVYSASQLLWNRLSPAGYLNHINQDLFPSTPFKNILIQYSLGDHEVTWLGAQQMGRSINAKMYKSNWAEYNETLYSLNWIDDDVIINTTEYTNASNVMISGWNYNQPQVPFINIPPNEGINTHDQTALQYNAQKAAYMLYAKGIIYNMCGGPCNGTFQNFSKSL